MQIEKITENFKNLVKEIDEKKFIFNFIECFDFPKSTIARLKKGNYNISKKDNELIWKRKIHFINSRKLNKDTHVLIDNLQKSSNTKRNIIRFLIVTDFNDFLSIDTKTNQTLDCLIKDLPNYANFFLPLLGIERFQDAEENLADIKAANQIGILYDQILIDNKFLNLEISKQDINVFFTRLLFLYYADDSEIFEKDLFLKSISEFTENNGSNLKEFFTKLFEILDRKEKKNLPAYFKDFPYVNGNLFKNKILLPKFTQKTRKMIIDIASLDWQSINPDILGSMLQAVVSPEERREDEMHYTSVSNILKVIGPLFLNDLNYKINNAGQNEKKLKNILKYIYNLKIFDPACGSGNFLIISYKQLCLLEIKIFKILNEINPDQWKMSISGISLSKFYGIEKLHYASETAKLSLWLAEHQMNIQFEEIFGSIKPSLPLTETGNILCSNAMDIEWNNFCQKDKLTSHIYIIGNPPYKGFARQNLDQKKDIIKQIKHLNGFKRLDYITLWFFKASKFMSTNKDTSCSFVSTNSICQGEHINFFWPEILKEIEIIFAIKSFKWSNLARNKAGVQCIIIGLSPNGKKIKRIIDGNSVLECNYISPYLTNEELPLVEKKQKPFSRDFPKMIVGNMPYDGGFLKLTENEFKKISQNFPESKKYLRKLIGGSEFINGIKRWCLWIDDDDLEHALNIKPIKERIEKVKNFRKKGGDVAKSLITKSHQFRFRNEAKKNFILVPYTSAHTRSYLPIGFFGKEFITLNSARIIFDSPLYIFGILSSRSHMLWIEKIGGKMGKSIRYSSELCYYTFSFLVQMSQNKKREIEKISLEILDEREKFPELNITKLYGSEMPKGLLDLHKKNDEIVDECIFNKKVFNEDEKIKLLFEKYTATTKKERLL